MTTARRFGALPEPPGGWSLWFGAAGMLLWCVSVVQADFSHMGPFGLVTVLGWPYFAGFALLVAGFSIELLHVPLRSGRVLLLVVSIVVVLFGTASAIEPTARLTLSWVHAGFVQYISEHGQVLENYDARFSWPGAFSLGAVLVGSTGQPDALSFLRWAPPVLELLYLPPLLVIARFSGVGLRAGWLGVVLFYASIGSTRTTSPPRRSTTCSSSWSSRRCWHAGSLHGSKPWRGVVQPSGIASPQCAVH